MWDLIVSVPDHCLSFYFFLSDTWRHFICFYFRKKKKIFRGCKDACEIGQTVLFPATIRTDLLSTLFMSLTFRISDKQMHVTCNCKSVHCIYAKSFAFAV